MKSWDEKNLRLAIETARAARVNGNHPFGAVLADQTGNVLLQAENTAVTDNDFSGHAEINLARMAARQFEHDYLATCTLYASTEPCPMCAGAIYWANIGRVVYALGEDKFYEMIGKTSWDVFNLPCREILSRGSRKIEVVGSIMEKEALQVHLGFWK